VEKLKRGPFSDAAGRRGVQLKNDKIDASNIAGFLSCDLLPECHMASTEIRDRRAQSNTLYG
jgi:hypothetical protein